MATAIGYNDGVAAEYNRLRDLDPGGTILKKDSKGKWLPLDSLDAVPLDNWKAWDKAERRARILKDDHDAAIANPTPPPDGGGQPPPAQTYKKVAPRVAYADGGSDARFCCPGQPGVERDGNGWRDEVASYDENGLCRGGRSGSPALTSARAIDGRAYCDLPTTGDPTKNTGSWAI